MSWVTSGLWPKLVEPNVPGEGARYWPHLAWMTAPSATPPHSVGCWAQPAPETPPMGVCAQR